MLPLFMARFQFTRPRGARPTFDSDVRASKVSIHAPARGATLSRLSFMRLTMVSIHAPARGATTMMGDVDAIKLFQFTRPRGARLHDLPYIIDGDAFQFTRPRGARPQCYHRKLAYLDVSIHAPARGATSERLGTLKRNCVSIHAPARGATITQGDITRREEVSIHAPARGATYKPQVRMRLTRRFNSRAREGRDTSAPIGLSGSWFQFTRPRGARLAAAPSTAPADRFQFTRPRGARPRQEELPVAVRLVSIHAPARGATAHIVSHYSTGPPLPISANILRSEHLGF